jgi:hypothetical protein
MQSLFQQEIVSIYNGSPGAPFQDEFSSIIHKCSQLYHPTEDAEQDRRNVIFLKQDTVGIKHRLLHRESNEIYSINTSFLQVVNISERTH